MPLQIVIDDVGWRLGYDGSLQNEPYRTGIERKHAPEDYLAIVRLEQGLGMRPQAQMMGYAESAPVHSNRIMDGPGLGQ